MDLKTYFNQAPCIFCGYDGPGFYQNDTHDKSCPYYSNSIDREDFIEHYLLPYMIYLYKKSVKLIKG